MADKKLTYQMVSPGQAWNNFVNSKDGHNAAAVTPSYLEQKDKGSEKNAEPKQEKKVMPSLYYEHMQKKAVQKDAVKEPVKETGKEAGVDNQKSGKKTMPSIYHEHMQKKGASQQQKEEGKNPEKQMEKE